MPNTNTPTVSQTPLTHEEKWEEALASVAREERYWEWRAAGSPRYAGWDRRD